MKTARVGNTKRWIEVSLEELKAMATDQLKPHGPTVHLHVDSYLCRDMGFTTNQIGQLLYYKDSDRFRVTTFAGSNNASFQTHQIRTIQQYPDLGWLRICLVVGKEEKGPGKHRYIPCLDDATIQGHKEPDCDKCDLIGQKLPECSVTDIWNN